MEIKEFQEGQSVDFHALIKSISLRETKTGKEYGAVELTDRSGAISGNLWDITDKQKSELTSGVVVHITGVISSYQGKLQIGFQSIQPTSEKAQEYVEAAPADLEKVMNYLTEFISSIENKHWRVIAEKIFEKHEEKFRAYPAAVKVHHAYAGGLAYHTSTMLIKAQAISKFYPWLNKELLCVGVLLHDIGKVLEMPGLFGENYTTEGELLGHLELLLEEIVEICVREDINHHEEDVLLLKHMVASHHGKLEWGTISTPRIPEAALLHMIDKMDAEMEQYRKIYEVLPKGEWTTSKEFFLGNTRVYRGNI
ncbi:3'-5' exoribonuclease [Pilibacter termitis]|uniref:3'-5' exoribonuclease n=1 Tax=Pilibacter termitis TaxID=263852 RepID=A0A1T4Q0P3_9ENTE|nr:OB-fold nucleic acid binding domain-containing protein [Pilibacter termitis]SJZ97107.1 3'-5' exoribonuclease [Pilibacter termitis]